MSCLSPDVQLHLGDCFELMKQLPDSSVDFVCTDMPYGWDCKIDLDKLWAELKRVAKPSAAFALFGAGKFAYKLVYSNFKDFRYRYCWDKCDDVTGFLNASRRPLIGSEDILIFSAGQGTYNPQRRDPLGGGKSYVHTEILPKNKRSILWSGPTCS